MGDAATLPWLVRQGEVIGPLAIVVLAFVGTAVALWVRRRLDARDAQARRRSLG